MRVFEQLLAQPMEEILALMWYKYRTKTKIAKQLGLGRIQVSNWMSKLGLYVCVGCSTYTGLLHLEVIKCEACGHNFCQECTDEKTDYHFNNAKDVTHLVMNPKNKDEDIHIVFQDPE